MPAPVCALKKTIFSTAFSKTPAEIWSNDIVMPMDVLANVMLYVWFEPVPTLAAVLPVVPLTKAVLFQLWPMVVVPPQFKSIVEKADFYDTYLEPALPRYLYRYQEYDQRQRFDLLH